MSKKHKKLLPPRYNPVFNDFIPENTLDFHYFSSLTPPEIEHILSEFIHNSYNLHLLKILIVTGKGKIVKPVVKKALSRNRLVESFSEANYYNGQSGAYEILLKK